MKRFVRVYFLPQWIPERSLPGRVVVVIDVLRATTTMVYALAHGATRVVPSRDPDEAQRIARHFAPHVLLGGERGGLRIAGFDLGNSPAEYEPAIATGKTIVFTTTNGTRALQRCLDARRILIGAFVNLSALCRVLLDCDRIDLVCAGTDGEVTREDTLFAGALLAKLREFDSAADVHHNDQAQLALDAWHASVGDPFDASRLLAALRASQGGRNLVEIGQAGDIELAAQVDRFRLVPELFRSKTTSDSGEFEIRAAP